MKVIRNLQITAGEFFGVVFSDLAGELRANGNPDLTPDRLKTGFTHTRNAEDPALKTTFEIAEYREDRFCKTVRTSAAGTVTVIYDVVPAETGITVTFTYEECSANPGKKKNGLFAAFSELIFLGRMTDALYAIQRSVINEKEGFTQTKSNSPFMPSIRKSK